MADAAASTFIYVIFIRTTPEKLWSALTDADFMRGYWFGMHIASDWSVGSDWTLHFTDGRTADQGEILEYDPPKRLVLTWRCIWKPEFAAEGQAKCTIELEPTGEAVKLSILHQIDHPNSAMIGAVSGGWPKILSNLKSLLETGEVVLKG